MAATTSAAVTEPNSLPESPAVFTGKRHGAQAVDGGLELVGVLQVAHGLGLAGATDVVGLTLRATGGRDGQATGQQVVTAVAVLDLDGVAGGTQVVDLCGENQFHRWYFRSLASRRA